MLCVDHVTHQYRTSGPPIYVTYRLSFESLWLEMEARYLVGDLMALTTRFLFRGSPSQPGRYDDITS